MIGQRLTMIAYVERGTSTGKDAWNMPVVANFQPLAEVPCFAYSKSGRDVVDGKKDVVVQDMRMMFGLGVDIREGDQVAKITDRSPARKILFRGPMRIEGAVEFKHNHQEAALVRVT